ncbi:uncharacterized protein LOC112569457 [Pomacea canaliculata]|uniref:uncharacterized protein LOC112569457 n=1 Tax=Pomacea canaliculata TaxID=400727 RepID=UPI000D736CEA|nr:uncharacterized protein LOC112569457 [Pomacea canaliculata]
MEHRVNTLFGLSLFILLPCASEWGSYGLSLDKYNGSIIVEESVMSKIEFSWRNLTAPYRAFVLHKPTDFKHFVTICRLCRSQDNCTSSNDHVCQCLHPDHFRLTKTFRVEDTGQLLFQLFDKTPPNTLVNISVIPKTTTTTTITPHPSRTTSLSSSTHSTPVAKWKSSSSSTTRKPMSSSSGSDVSATAQHAGAIIAITVAMLCVSAVAIVSSVVMGYRLRSLRQQARDMKQEAETFDVPGYS